jgi:hypothetical protein
MKKIKTLTIATLAVLAVWVSMPAFAQYPDYLGDSSQKVTQKQLEECKELGIPEFACTEQTLLAKKRVIKVEEKDAYGSGKGMLAQGFGEMGAIIAAIGAIFGGVAIAFFARSRIGKQVPI